jgi:hypothetical protein
MSRATALYVTGVVLVLGGILLMFDPFGWLGGWWSVGMAPTVCGLLVLSRGPTVAETAKRKLLSRIGVAGVGTIQAIEYPWVVPDGGARDTVGGVDVAMPRLRLRLLVTSEEGIPPFEAAVKDVFTYRDFPKVGQRVLVRYDPENPRRVMITGGPPSDFTPTDDAAASP